MTNSRRVAATLPGPSVGSVGINSCGVGDAEYAELDAPALFWMTEEIGGSNGAGGEKDEPVASCKGFWCPPGAGVGTSAWAAIGGGGGSSETGGAETAPDISGIKTAPLQCGHATACAAEFGKI